MNSIQENEYSRNMAVQKKLTSFSAELSATPHFTETLSALQAANLKINTTASQQVFDKKYLASDKQQLRTNIENTVADYIRKMKVFATFENKPTLLAEITEAEKTYKSLPETEFLNQAKGIFEKAEDNITGLATYEITPATQTSFENLTQDYEEIIFSPRENVATRKQIAVKLAAEFKEARAELKNMDLIMDMVKISKPDVYAAYRSARKIVSSGTSLFSMKVKLPTGPQSLPCRALP